MPLQSFINEWEKKKASKKSKTVLSLCSAYYGKFRGASRVYVHQLLYEKYFLCFKIDYVTP